MSKAFERFIDAAHSNGRTVIDHGGYCMVQCAAHNDGRPSLSVKPIEGSVLLYCMAGCDTPSIVEAFGLAMADLFDEPLGQVYEYPGGRRVVRTPDKRFFQEGDKKDRSLFRSDRITNDLVYVTEGEKDVLAIESVGGQAVSPPNGANSKPEKYDWGCLRGRHVRIVTDRDEVGRKHAEELADHLEGLAASVRVVVPVVGKDASDHIAAGHTLEDFVFVAPPDVLTLSEAFDAWRQWRDSEQAEPIPTPWTSLNNKISGGLHPGGVVIIGARTGQGKSVAGQNIVSYAVEMGHPCLVVSVEMPVHEVVSRIISSQAGVDYGEIRRRDFEAISPRVDEYIMKSRSLPMYLCDNPTVTIEQIAQRCRVLKEQAGLELVFIDYAQLITASDKRVSRQEQVAHIVRSAKILAMELQIVVILAAQLNRDSEGEDNNGQPVLPKRKDLRESGELEQSADLILLLHRSRHSIPPTMYVTVAKNRYGPEGSVQLVERFDRAKIESGLALQMKPYGSLELE